MAGRPTQGAVTPDRKTVVKLDVDDHFGIEPVFIFSRTKGEISPVALDGVHYVPNIGWTLEPKHRQLHLAHEKGQADANRLDATVLTMASGYEEEAQFRKPSELPGATTGIAGDVSDGDMFHVRKVPSGDSWISGLTADQAASPLPDTVDDTVKMDRHAVSNDSYRGDIAWMVRFIVPGSAVQTPGRFFAFSFSGMGPGKYGASIGTGKYVVVLQGDGRAKLYEGLEAGGHTLCAEFQWARAGLVPGAQHHMYIRSYLRGGPSLRYIIAIETTAPLYLDGALLQPRAFNDRHARGDEGNGTLFTFRVPYNPSSATPEAPVRVDVRRDMRVKFQVSKANVPLTGTLRDAPFSVPFWPTQSLPLVVDWDGNPRTGTISCSLYYADDDTAVPVADSGSFWKSFQPDGNHDPYYYAEFTLTVPAQSNPWPILRGYQVFKNGLIETVAPGEIELSNIPDTGVALTQVAPAELALVGPSGDLREEHGTLRVADLTMGLTLLQNRASIPIKIETQYDAGDPNLRSVLFRGYAQRNQAERWGRAGTVYPDPNWSWYELELEGMGRRFSEQFSQIRINFHGPNYEEDWADPETALPWRASDAINALLSWAGFPSTMRAIAQDPLRLWPNPRDGEEGLLLDVGDPLMDMAVRIARDFFGGWLVFDANCGTYGKWRLIRGTRGPFAGKNLAAFVSSGPGGGGDVGTVRLGHILTAYPTTTDGDREVPTVPILKGRNLMRPRREVIPPEANAVLVTGVGLISPQDSGHLPIFGTRDTAVRLTQYLVNPRSYNFRNLPTSDPDYPDPDHPDYLGRIVPLFFIDPGLLTEEAVNWTCRRLYDFVAHGSVQWRFVAPLVLVEDPDDAEQTSPRPLRHYDPVLFRGEQYLVRSCNIHYTRDRMQLATYEVYRPSWMTE